MIHLALKPINNGNLGKPLSFKSHFLHFRNHEMDRDQSASFEIL